MGNTLNTGKSNYIINDSDLGKELQSFLKQQQEVDRTTGIPYSINTRRACCMGIVGNSSNFLSIPFPYIDLSGHLDSNNVFDSSGCASDTDYCVKTLNLGLRYTDENKDICIEKNNEVDFFVGEYTKTGDSLQECDKFMRDYCAKSLHEQNCLITETNDNDDTILKWNTSNPRCFMDDKKLFFGPMECACLNSQTGYSLNNAPGRIRDISGNITNPLGLTTESDNVITTYSVNLFGYEPYLQKPKVFDERCYRRSEPSYDSKNNITGVESRAYRLEDERTDKNITICLAQINIKGSNIGKANLSNIKQNNNCNGGSSTDKLPVDETSNPVVVNESTKEDPIALNSLRDQAQQGEHPEQVD